MAASTDLRTLIAGDIRFHPRVAYQGGGGPDIGAQIASDLPPMPPFRNEYFGAIAVVDWDHKLPSQLYALRIYAYYSESSFEQGEEAFDDRLEEIGRRDVYPEFDVPDFDNLPADEAYEIEVTTEREIGRCRLTSAWRRTIDTGDAAAAVAIASAADEYIKLAADTDRPNHLGDLEAVSWTPPCESQHSRWTLDVWYLLAFDGRVGTGRSFLVDLHGGSVTAARDFSVRTS